MAPRNLNFITGNANKLKEVSSILSSTPVELKSQNLDLPELQGTIEEISRDKCSRAADIVCLAWIVFATFEADEY
jgi:inosine triphosphate pyrophosphatase